VSQTGSLHLVLINSTNRRRFSGADISGRRAKYHNCCFRQTTNSLLY